MLYKMLWIPNTAMLRKLNKNIACKEKDLTELSANTFYDVRSLPFIPGLSFLFIY